MWIKRGLAYGIVVVLAVVLVHAYFTGLAASPKVLQQSCAEMNPEPVDQPASDFELEGLDGKKLRLSSLRGKTVLLHFWATWCPPCLEELPSLFQLQANITTDRFKLLTVSVDDSTKVVKEFFTANSLPPLPVVIDTSQTTPHRYGTTKFPESYLIDAKGMVRYRFVNQRNWGSPEATACLRSVIH